MKKNKKQTTINSIQYNNLDIDEKIPEELYEAVAEIIFYVYNLDSKKEG